MTVRILWSFLVLKLVLSKLRSVWDQHKKPCGTLSNQAKITWVVVESMPAREHAAIKETFSEICIAEISLANQPEAASKGRPFCNTFCNNTRKIQTCWKGLSCQFYSNVCYNGYLVCLLTQTCVCYTNGTNCSQNWVIMYTCKSFIVTYCVTKECNWAIVNIWVNRYLHGNYFGIY